jgi:DedD protein
MDHELKQRLIGAVVVTALAAIFIPMLFDDPVDTSGKTVSELTMPQAPADAPPEATPTLPENKEQVLNRKDIELEAREITDDGLDNATGEAPVTNVPDGGQSGQDGIADATNDPSLEQSGSVPNDGVASDQNPGQSKVPEPDTGVVHGDNQQEANQNTEGTATGAVKKPLKSTESTIKKPESKPVVSEETKLKPASPPEKPKIEAKAQNEPTKKPSSKLVRYSIQAGSFNKKENAQALVEKLRKQGMPATLVTKGDLFRVKIGPSLNKEKAKEMKTKLDKQNIKGLLVSE